MKFLQDLAPDYPELRHLRPDEIRLRYQEPLYDAVIDSSLLSEALMRRDANGQERIATKDDQTFLRIAVVFGTPLPPNDGGRGLPGVSERWQPLLEDVHREVVPGTDMVLLVEAASKDRAFVRRLRESTVKLRPALE